MTSCWPPSAKPWQSKKKTERTAAVRGGSFLCARVIQNDMQKKEASFGRLFYVAGQQLLLVAKGFIFIVAAGLFLLDPFGPNAVLVFNAHDGGVKDGVKTGLVHSRV